MAPDDLKFLVMWITGIIGGFFEGIGKAFTDSAANPLQMNDLTLGIFGEQGGLIYWCNEKLLWLIEQILEGLSFTSLP